MTDAQEAQALHQQLSSLGNEVEELEEQIEKLTEGLGQLKLRIQMLQNNHTSKIDSS